jgi:hypothetical protein
MTMIRCVVYLLRIFKMFHGLMNKPVYTTLKFLALQGAPYTRIYTTLVG